MLQRQRTTLALLQEAGQALSATQLFKLVFLLAEETSLGRDGAFYDFLPYKFGPYSFALYRELEALVSQGYMNEQHSGSTNTYSITSLGTREQNAVGSDARRSVRFICEKYGKLGIKQLLRSVYAQYPWYSTRSELDNLVPLDVPKPSIAPPAVYTMGYEERSVDGFFDKLLRVGIQSYWMCVQILSRANMDLPRSPWEQFLEKSVLLMSIGPSLGFRRRSGEELKHLLSLNSSLGIMIGWFCQMNATMLSGWRIRLCRRLRFLSAWRGKPTTAIGAA